MFIVFDLDGTLADIEHRRHFVTNGNNKWDEFFKACIDDTPNKEVISTFHAMKCYGHDLEIWSGRMETVRSETEWWIEENIGYLPTLKMRLEKDYTPDDKLKLSWLNSAPKRPDIVFDDRDCVVKMWRDEGVSCFQVASGNF